MCGITGILSPVRDDAQEKRVRQSLWQLRHRGPDGAGLHQLSHGSLNGWLGHARLAIIDVQLGHQPMIRAETALVFNGEIFNFKELRNVLQGEGQVFSTESDTEVLLHHLRQGGISGISKLNGMFAFAYQEQSKVILARDRAGIKPLFYWHDPSSGTLAFASELLALLALLPRQPELSSKNIQSFFFFDFFQDDKTPFQGIKKLRPGEILEWSNGQIHLSQFWQPESLTKEAPNIRVTLDESLEQLEHLFSTAVERQLVSDRPLGFFLSGGIDSSLVTSFGSKLSNGSLKSFSVAFEDKTFNEAEFARQVAKHLGTDHSELLITESTMLSRVDEILGSLDEPLADHSYIPTYLLNEFAHQHVTVALGGDGGDELFAGYKTYGAHRHYKLLSKLPFIFSVGRQAADFFPTQMTYQSFDWKLKRFMNRSEPSDLLRHLRWMAGTDLVELDYLFSDSKREEIRSDILSRPWSEKSSTLRQLTALDFNNYMSSGVLQKADRASMRHSLELRPPFLDNSIVDFAFSLPDNYRLNGSQTKFILKKLAERHLPHDVVHRKKHGFSVPLSKWMCGPLGEKVKSVLKDSPLWDLNLLKREAFQKYYEQHQLQIVDRSKTLWSLLSLDRWLRGIV